VQKIKGFILFVILFLVTSCEKNELMYSVETSELESYLQKFLAEAKNYGYEFDLEKDGLIMQFSDNLGNNVLGLCTHSVPLKVEFNRKYWKDVTKYEDGNDRKEFVVFHELGHGLLDRRHYNEKLPNGEWKSIMCGGDLDDSESTLVNYRGERKKYYIEELFTQSADIPEWSKTSKDYDLTDYVCILDDEFNSEDECNYPITSSTNVVAKIVDGKYCVENNYSVFLPVRISMSGVEDYDNFIYEVNLSSEADMYGILAGNVTDEVKDMDYMLINNSQNIFVGNLSGITWSVSLSDIESILPNKTNKLSILKENGVIYFFINETFVYKEFVIAQKHNSFGFFLSPQSTLSVEDAKIYINESNRTMTKGVVMCPFESVELNRLSTK